MADASDSDKEENVEGKSIHEKFPKKIFRKKIFL